MGAKRRIGIMTGGGDCPGLNAVIRAVVKVGMRQGWEMLGIEDAFHGLVDLGYRSPHGNLWLGSDQVHDILPRGGTILGTSNRADPFHFPMKRDGEVVLEDVSDRVLEHFGQLGLEALISIGGDGSMAIAKRLADKGMPVVGVPKTIDNDIAATDVTFGFDTAVQIATEALDRIHDTAESHDRVMIVELMGRDAGFIALEAGLAGGAHVILIPEVPYRLAPIVDRIRNRCARSQPYSVLVVAEGACPAGDDIHIEPVLPGAMPRPSGAAARLAAGLEGKVDAETRITVLGHLQRGGSPTGFDRVLATRYGHHAAQLVADRTYGHMVALRCGEIISVPLEEAVGREKRVDPDGQIVRTARAIGVVFGDEA